MAMVGIYLFSFGRWVWALLRSMLESLFLRRHGSSWKINPSLLSVIIFSLLAQANCYAVNEPVSGWCQFIADNSVGMSHAEAAQDCADVCTMDDVTSSGNPRHRECKVIGSGNQGKTQSGSFYSQYVAHDLELVTTETLPNGSTSVVTLAGNFFTSIQKFCVVGEIKDGNICITCPDGQEWDAASSQCKASSKNDPLCPAAPNSNPINLASGNKHQVEIDIPASSARELSFQRFYSSSAIYGLATAFKGYWRHNYELTIAIRGVNDDKAYLTRADGRRLQFDKMGGIWESSVGGTGALQDILDGNNAIIGWVYTSQDNSTEIYNRQGFVTSIADNDSYTLSFEYDLDGGSGGDDSAYSLDRISDSVGNSLLFSYVENRLAGVTDSSGNVYSYGYDANGRVISVTLPDNTPGDNTDNPQRLYHYENIDFPQALTGITDERGIRYATFEYDDQGRATASYHGPQTGVLTDRIDGVSVVYNDTNDTRTITNSNGDASIYSTAVQLGVALVTDVSGPSCSTCGGSNTSYQYDPANNNLLSKTENGITTEYGNYDAQGQYGYRIEAVGTPEERRLDYTYDSRFFNKITSITEPSVFAANSKVTTYSYDDFGNRRFEIINGFDPIGSAVSRSTNWQYNGPLNQLSQVDGPRTDVSDITTYRYYADDAGQGDNRARLREIEDAHGVLLRSNIQYSATGKVLSESRPNGLTLTYSYYPGNDRLETLAESDGIGSRVTQWTYLATGEVETITTGFGSFEATTLTFGYDDARRLTRITDGLGNYLEYTLDTEGNRTFEKTFDTTATLKKQLSQTFDSYNRLDTTGQANESVDYSFAPDGTLDTQTAGGGAVTDYSYDALKRLTQVIQDQSGGDPDTADTSTGYGYDVADRLTSVTDPSNGNTHYVYDDLGNLVSQISPDTGSSTFTYDGAGNLKTRTDAKGQLFSYSYDALNRLTALDAPATDDDVSYAYDTCVNGQGRLCTVTLAPASNEPIVTGYTYTALGDVATHQGVTYTYDQAGRVKTVTYPSGAVVTSHYDSTGQVSQVELTVDGQTQTLADGISYHPFGPVANLSYGNGETLTQAVDQAYRFTTLAVPGVLNLAAHQYDGNGNLLQRDAGTGTPVLSTFGYDALDRLEIAGGPFGTRDYDYDPNGNRTNLVADATPTAYAYEIGSNRLDTLGSSDVLLDANGNTLNQGNWTYSYTPGNRLKTAGESGSQVASYAYNGLGQRVEKQTSTGTVIGYVYGLTGELLAELDVAGTPLAEYIYLNGQPLAVRQYTNGSGTAVDQIVDNRDAGTTASGSWAGSTVVAGFAGSDYQHHTGSTVPPGGTLVDNGGAGFSVTGTWPVSTIVTGFEGADYQFHEADGLPPGALIIDDASADTSRVGTWPTSTSTSGFEGSHYSVHGAGVGDNSFSWHLSGMFPGDYHVYAKWTAHSNRASNAVYTVNHAGGVTPVTVDQRQSGGEWVLLGTFALDVASEVVLSDAANGYVIADAIRAIPVNAAPNTATWAPSLPSAGPYQVYAHWTAHPNRATLATYTVHHSGGSTDVPVDQQQNSGEWRLLGTFDLDNTSQVTLTDEADGVVIADAVYFVPEGTPYNSFSWQPDVPGAGQYEVLARWTAHANRASNASYAITHTGGSTTVAVDQRQSGGTWVSLGIYTLDADSEVTLTDQADGYVIADAIRVVGTTDAGVGGTYFIHTDHLGTPVAMSDGAAVKVWSATHDPFGQATVDEDPDGNGTAVTLNVRFPGQYYDQETGLHYNGFRTYDPSTGRYLTSDPIGLLGGSNTFSYVSGNPIRFGDPLGLVETSFYPGAPDYVKKRINSNLDALERGLINQTASCPLATDRFLDLMFRWNISVSNSPSRGGLAGKTKGGTTTLPRGSGTLNDLAHEFYHLTPENLNRNSGRGAYDPDNAAEETGQFGARIFANTLENNQCLCRFFTGEEVRPQPVPQPRRDFLKLLRDSFGF